MKLSERAVALISAALRHVRDAEHLLDPGPECDHSSLDQAVYLAGYGPECARKATLGLGEYDRLIGHGGSRAAALAVEVASALDPFALRYAPPEWAERYPALSKWDVAARYRKTGTATLGDVTAIVSDCRNAVDAIVVALWADGRLPDEVRGW